MTKPDPKAVVKALELASQVQHMDGVLSCSNIRKECKAALLIARSIAEQWDELVECKEALEWILSPLVISEKEYILNNRNCPAIIKQMVEKEGKR